MKKRFWLVLLAILSALCLIVGLTACADGDPTAEGTEQTSPGGNQDDTQGGSQGGSHTHQYSSSWSSDDVTHWHAATCGHSEKNDEAAHTYQNGVCTTCYHAHENHSYGTYTSNESGHSRTCSVCHKTETGSHTYVNGVCTTCNHAHQNHTFGNWAEKEKPTCTADGYKERICSVCHKAERDTITALGHSYEKGICTVCGGVEGLVAFRTLEVSDDDTVYGKVSNQTQTFSFIQEVIAADDVTFTVSYDLGGSNTIPSKTVSLGIGDNTYYVLASRGNLLKLYTVTVRRRPVYNVSFETSGSAVSSQQVEEDSMIVAPAATTKRGYTFQHWTLGGEEASFPYMAEEGIPQTGSYNVTISAVFTANEYKATFDANGGEVSEDEQTVTFRMEVCRRQTN